MSAVFSVLQNSGGRATASARLLDPRRLLSLRREFARVSMSQLIVLEDVDGDCTRFFCMGSARDFGHGEAFLAACVKRFLVCVEDRRLAELMYIDGLEQQLVEEPITLDVLRSRFDAVADVSFPEPWLERLQNEAAPHIALLNSSRHRLEVVARTDGSWLYGLIEP